MGGGYGRAEMGEKKAFVASCLFELRREEKWEKDRCLLHAL